MTNIAVDKSTDNAEPLSICFLPQYSTPKKVFISEPVQNQPSDSLSTILSFSKDNSVFRITSLNIRQTHSHLFLLSSPPRPLVTKQFRVFLIFQTKVDLFPLVSKALKCPCLAKKTLRASSSIVLIGYSPVIFGFSVCEKFNAPNVVG